LKDDYDVTAYFYDPNIHPKEEYKKRFQEMKRWCAKINLKLIEAPYDVERWHELVRGHEDQPEKGSRCTICYEMRMRQAFEFAKENGYEFVATVLSISPHKDHKRISEIGNRLAETVGANGNSPKLKFVDQDWKKNDGFKIASRMSAEENFYRQNYCGCVYSKKKQ